MRRAWLGARHHGADQRFRKRGRANPVHFRAEAERCTRRMHVGIDRPGMTVRPCRSIVRVVRPASFRISSSVPSARTFHRGLQGHYAENDASTTRILPFTRTVSGTWADADAATATQRTADNEAAYEPLAHDSPPRRSPSPDGGEHTTPPSSKLSEARRGCRISPVNGPTETGYNEMV